MMVMMTKTFTERPLSALVCAGGLALGAYQGGAYETFHNDNGCDLDWVAGSSVGAVNGALIAGNAPEMRISRLREFWSEPATGQVDQPLPFGRSRYLQNWLNAIQTRLIGAPGHFRPRLPSLPFEDFKSLYDLAPMRRSLERLVDFEYLNSSKMRLSIATTDVESGHVVWFDSARERLTSDHLLASCGMIPEFAPVMISDRLLADGGLSANAPVEPILADSEDRIIFVLDLFARDGGRPRSLAAAVARKNELMFSNQTLRLLEFWGTLNDTAQSSKRVMYLSYRASGDEADAEKLFDLSAMTAADRWAAGARDMQAALQSVRSNRSDRLIIVR
jgi:NTE family protein